MVQTAFNAVTLEVYSVEAGAACGARATNGSPVSRAERIEVFRDEQRNQSLVPEIQTVPEDK